VDWIEVTRERQQATAATIVLARLDVDPFPLLPDQGAAGHDYSPPQMF
jgi:hypothetical protein